MATDSPLIRDGGNLISGFDARNSSTWLGSTAMAGQGGSGQFLAVRLSTVAARTVLLASTATSGVQAMGILQNKPSTGIAADVGIFGVTKAVAGATIGIGGNLMVSSTAPGTLIPYSSGAGVYPFAQAYEAATVGQIFTAALYGFGGMPSGI